jgi:hypothetical protein
LAVLGALALSLLLSAQGADARLKSEWRFGGSVAGTIMSLPLASALFEDAAAFDDSILTKLLPFAAQPAGGSLGELFNRPGLVGGFAAGFLGAGLLGVLFGHGIYGELNGATSVLGLLFQLALILLLGRLIWSWWRADRVSAFADLSPRQLADAYGRVHHEALPDIDSPASADPGPGESDNKTLR